MKEIVVISGKGGTGKTSLVAAFAVLAGRDVVVADCDVDAADLHLLLAPDFARAEAFHAGELAVVDADACTGCGLCADVCRFGAVTVADDAAGIDPLDCEGCGYCARVCPTQAITNVERLVGQWYRSQIRTGATMVHARLGIGAENSGKLVARVKGEAQRAARELGAPLVLVDGSPGVGCPVVSSLAGASLVLLVVEPTTSGLHDLIRVHELVRRFDIPMACVINKADLNENVRRELTEHLARLDTPVVAELPYDERFTAAIAAGRTVVEVDDALGEIIRDCWEALRARIQPARSQT